MDQDPVAYVVLRGEDESTSIVLYAADVAILRRCLDSPSDDAEQRGLNERLGRLLGASPDVRPRFIGRLGNLYRFR